MRLTRAASLISAAALVGLSASCTWISTPEYLDALACVDLDNDGATAGDCEGMVKDCNDNPDQGGASENPLLATPEAEDATLWYDGFDNDCSYNGSGTEHDVLDADGDGFPGIIFDDWVKQGIDKEWPPNLSKDAGSLDCDDINAAIFPDASDDPYDGIDSDCDNADDFDADGDGYIPSDQATTYATFSDQAWYTDLPAGDCDDSRADVNPGPNATADEFYDGVDHDCAGNNDFDADNDQYIPREYLNQCAAYNSKYDYSVPCNAGIDAATYPDGDCNEANININPGATDAWYNGIDENCKGDDDYDADGDGYIPDAWETVYQTYAAQDWWLNLETGDCNDTNPAVRPGELEIMGDNFDQDCDGDIDTTSFAFGGYMYMEPLAPVFDANDHHYLLAAAGAIVSRPAPADPKDNAGISLAFPFTAGFEAPVEREIEWQTLNTEPLTDHIDMIAGGDKFYVSFSYQKEQAGNNNNWLFIRENTTSNGGANYSQVLIYSKKQTDPLYHDLDLREDSNNVFWAAACGDGAVHFIAGGLVSGRLDGNTTKSGVLCEDGTSTLIIDQANNIPQCGETYNVGGDHCSIEFSGGNAYLHSFGDTEGAHTYALDRAAETITEDSGSPWAPLDSYTEMTSMNTRDNLTTFSLAGSGVEVLIGSTTYPHLHSARTETGTDYNVLDADAIEHDGTLYIAAIVEDLDADGFNDVVLAYGNKIGTLEDVVFPYNPPDGANDQNPMGVTLHVDDDRVAMAVSAYSDVRPPSSETECPRDTTTITLTQAANCALDTIGWVFLGTPN